MAPSWGYQGRGRGGGPTTSRRRPCRGRPGLVACRGPGTRRDHRGLQQLGRPLWKLLLQVVQLVPCHEVLYVQVRRVPTRGSPVVRHRLYEVFPCAQVRRSRPVRAVGFVGSARPQSVERCDEAVAHRCRLPLVVHDLGDPDDPGAREVGNRRFDGIDRGHRLLVVRVEQPGPGDRTIGGREPVRARPDRLRRLEDRAAEHTRERCGQLRLTLLRLNAVLGIDVQRCPHIASDRVRSAEHRRVPVPRVLIGVLVGHIDITDGHSEALGKCCGYSRCFMGPFVRSWLLRVRASLRDGAHDVRCPQDN